MSFGIRVFSSSGSLQLDENYKVYRIIYKGTGTTGTRVTYPELATPPLIFVRPPLNEYVSMRFVPGSGLIPDVSGSIINDGFHLVCVDATTSNYVQKTVSFEYLVLTEVQPTPNGFGLAIYGESSQTFFGSNEDYFMIDTINQLVFSAQTNGAVYPQPQTALITTTTPPDSKRRWICANHLYGSSGTKDQILAPPYLYADWFCAKLVSESQIEYKGFKYSENSSPVNFYPNPTVELTTARLISGYYP